MTAALASGTTRGCLRLSEISQSFGSRAVLHRASADLEAGKLYGIIGPNGAGKTTLLRIIAGLLPPERGHVELDGIVLPRGRRPRLRWPGISYIAQELSLVEDWTVKQQLKHELRTEPEMTAAFEFISSLGVEVPVDAMIRHLTGEQRQILEIAKGLGRAGQVLLLDEPTSGLTMRQRQVLFDGLRRRVLHGALALVVSHDQSRLHEIADALLEVRDGQLIPVPRRTRVRRCAPSPDAKATSPIDIELDGGGVLRVRAPRGQILGITGELHTGVHDLLRRAFGLASPPAAWRKDGEQWRATVAASHDRGIRYMSRNRNNEWGFPEAPVWFTLGTARHSRRPALARVSTSRDRAWTATVMTARHIVPKDPDKPLRFFSGGNRQKAVMAAMLEQGGTVFLLDEPLNGIDEEARRQLAETLRDLCMRTATAIIYSQEREDLSLMCDRVVTFS